MKRVVQATLQSRRAQPVAYTIGTVGVVERVWRERCCLWCASDLLLEAHWRRTCGALTAAQRAGRRESERGERVISSVYGTAPAKGDSRRERVPPTSRTDLPHRSL